MDQTQFAQLCRKLDTLSRLLALNVVAGKKFIEQVATLSSVGFMPKEIADVLGKTPHNVSVQLDKVKKSKKSGRGTEDEVPSEGGD